MTATLVSKNLENCFASGIDAYLPKPYTRQQFAEIVNRLINRVESDEQLGDESLPEPLANELMALAAQRWSEKVDLMRLAHEKQDLPTLKKMAHDCIGLAGMIPQSQRHLELCRRLEASESLDSIQLEWISQLATVVPSSMEKAGDM